MYSHVYLMTSMILPTAANGWFINKKVYVLQSVAAIFIWRKCRFTLVTLLLTYRCWAPPKQATTTLLKQSYSPLSLKTSGTSSLDIVPTIIKGILKFAQIFSHFLGPIFKLVPFFSNQMPWKKTTRRSFSISVLHYVLLCFV